MLYLIFFFFNDTATTEIYTLSLHDALPICDLQAVVQEHEQVVGDDAFERVAVGEAETDPKAVEFGTDRKSTRLNSSHQIISYAVFCLKKKTTKTKNQLRTCA